MKFLIFGGLFELDNKIKRLSELNKIINSDNFWQNSDNDKILKEYNSLKNLVDNLTRIKNKIDSNTAILQDSVDDEMLQVIYDEYEEIFVCKLK